MMLLLIIEITGYYALIHLTSNTNDRGSYYIVVIIVPDVCHEDTQHCQKLPPLG
jgi:hypothetical protein